ncbi:hypothetical protein Pint_23976 [Pistacia integerrima]|uniref:Uncharacterized protein n=1 Tax=Pistacia integerrima TaxID=434235 RepID=A0ACC0YGS0_9ROSI|nr:hypothetical protein Pint_23976 [Pistacia integerrima]
MTYAKKGWSYPNQNSMAAALSSVAHSFLNKIGSTQELRSRGCPRLFVLLACQSREPMETSRSTETKKEKKEKNYKLLFSQLFIGAEKFGKGLKENLSPQKKGDWKDLVLMSLSFAVYVYMSQRIVCAYCAWMSMPKQSW